MVRALYARPARPAPVMCPACVATAESGNGNTRPTGVAQRQSGGHISAGSGFDTRHRSHGCSSRVEHWIFTPDVEGSIPSITCFVSSDDIEGAGRGFGSRTCLGPRPGPSGSGGAVLRADHVPRVPLAVTRLRARRPDLDHPSARSLDRRIGRHPRRRAAARRLRGRSVRAATLDPLPRTPPIDCFGTLKFR